MRSQTFRPEKDVDACGYRLKDKLGAGGFGEVWNAEGPGGFSVALKFVKLEEKVAKAEFKALEVLKAVRHPNLVTTFGTWQLGGYLVIAMELGDKTLKDRLEEIKKERRARKEVTRGIPVEELLEYFREAAKAIDYLNEPCHTIGGKAGLAVQHRDIKPTNILLVGKGVKVGDFGLARFTEHTVTENSGSFTPAYAAPEVLGGKTCAQSDQYSLAVSYCALRGEGLPFSGTVHEILIGHLQGSPNLAMVPDPERAVVGKALAKVPGNRWPSCTAFVEALRACQLLAALSPPESARSSPAEGAAAGATCSLQPATDSTAVGEGPGGVIVAGPAPPAAVSIIPLGKEWDTVSGSIDTSRPKPSPSSVPVWPNKSSSKKTVVLCLGAGLLATAAVVLLSSGIFTPPDGEPESPSGENQKSALGKLKHGGPRDSADKTEPNADKAGKKINADKKESKGIADQGMAKDKKVMAVIKDKGGSTANSDKGQPKVAKVEPTIKLLIPQTLELAVGGRKSFSIEVVRQGCEGPVNVRFEGLPKGLTIERITIPKDAKECRVEAAVSMEIEKPDRDLRVSGSCGEIKNVATCRIRINVGEYTNSIGMKLVRVPPGKFKMGSPANEEERENDEIQHDVEITRPYYMGAYPVTQEEYEEVMDKTPSYFSKTGEGNEEVKDMDTSRFPVERVSWKDAQDFCNKLTALDKEKGFARKYRLPTEAEWEYACREAGKSTTPFYFGESLGSDQANIDGNYPYGEDAEGEDFLERTTKVGSYKANTLGLYDMHGNVWQWCSDWYDEDYSYNSDIKDPQGAKNGLYLVLRGGSWWDSAANCRAATRLSYVPGTRFNYVGFRVVCAVPPRSPEK